METNEQELETDAAPIEVGAAGQSPATRLRLHRRSGSRIVQTALAFALGLGSGYLVWGRATPRLNSAAQPASGSVVTSATSTPSPDSAIDVLALAQQVNPPRGYTLPATFSDIGPRLLAAGTIDFDRFVQLYQEAGQPLTEQQLVLLTKGTDEPIVIDRENAHFLLNFLWAVGLTNQNPILTEGRMMSGGRAQVNGFASTGGWTLATKPVTELFASIPLIPLTPEQQARLVEVAQNVYRPCCNNPTHFPDCNHGMAMLGLLELLASQGATVGEMFEAAKYINAFWYPQQTLEQAVLFKARNGIDFDQVEPREIVGVNYSSAAGFRTAHQWLANNGLLKQSPNGGSYCGVSP